MTDICTICLNPLSNASLLTISCGHTFHSDCILNWFRSPSSTGGCPLCLDNPYNSSDNLSWPSKQIINQRCKVLRYYSKRKIAPSQLISDFDNLKELESKLKIQITKCKEIKNDEEYKKIIEKFKEENRKRWKLIDKIEQQKLRIIAKFPILVY